MNSRRVTFLIENNIFDTFSLWPKCIKKVSFRGTKSCIKSMENKLWGDFMRCCGEKVSYIG